MERFTGGFKQGFGRIGIADKGPAKGKFKLSLSRVSLPPQTNKQPNQESNPKAKFSTSAGAGLGINKQNMTKTRTSSVTAKSIMRLPANDEPRKKTLGFSFMNYQPKSRDSAKATCNTVSNTTQVASTETKLLLDKFAVNAVSKKSSAGAAATNDKVFLFNSREKGALPLAARSESNLFSSKKRKAAQDKKDAFPNKSVRCNTKLTCKNHSCTKETGIVKTAGPFAKMIESSPFTTQTGGMKTKSNNEAIFKKRSSLGTSTVVDQVIKRSKTSANMLSMTGTSCAYKVLEHTANKTVKDKKYSSDYACNGNVDSGLSAPTAPTVLESPAQNPPRVVADGPASVELNAVSSDCREECDVEELAMNTMYTIDDDNEEELFLRAAALQECTDRMGLEQKRLCNRLLDAHADVSESLLDALTDLMVEEGGVGIDKLDFDVNVDVNFGDAFLQDDELKKFQ